MKILFLTQTSQIGASARYRVYQFLSYLKEGGIEYSVIPAISDVLLKRYHESSNLFTKFQYYSSQILRRLADLQKIRKFDVIFIQRDIIIHIFPFIEKLITLFNKNIIFDFDDALYLYPSHKKTGFLFKLLWDRKKIERIIRLSKHVIAGNNFLRDFARNFTENVTVIPTSVDLNVYENTQKLKNSSSLVSIGWIGSQGTFSYLKQILPVFEELAKKYDIEIRVVGARGPLIDGLRIKYKDWSLAEEVEDISKFDIGVMPLVDDEWSRGKSATKLLQYMAAGVPAVASPVGVNNEIVKDGVNGFLAKDQEEWIKKISMLVENIQLRNETAANAKEDVEKFYSIQANSSKFLGVINRVALSN